MGILLAELAHGVLQSAGHFSGAEIFVVEKLHQLGSALIVDIPQREEERGRTGIE
jgi:hypothetical protein